MKTTKEWLQGFTRDLFDLVEPLVVGAKTAGNVRQLLGTLMMQATFTALWLGMSEEEYIERVRDTFRASKLPTPWPQGTGRDGIHKVPVPPDTPETDADEGFDTDRVVAATRALIGRKPFPWEQS